METCYILQQVCTRFAVTPVALCHYCMSLLRQKDKKKVMEMVGMVPTVHLQETLVSTQFLL